MHQSSTPQEVGKGSERPHAGAPGAPGQDRPGAPGAPSNGDLLLPYLLPYGAYVAIATLAGDLGRETDYAIRIVVTGCLLLAFWKRYPTIAGPRSVLRSVLLGAVVGLVGVGVWIALLLPFQDAAAGTPFPATAFALRLAAATLVVPLIEELLFRGYVFGFVTQWQEARRAGAADPLGVALDQRSVHRLSPGAWTWAAVALSSVAFALGHAPAQWAAALGYGLLMAGLRVVRQDLVAPITAHAVTNFVLYLYVFYSGNWGLW